jgi:protoheme IX farnesyltransferase
MLPAVEASGRITARQIVIFTLLLLPISLGPFFAGLSGWPYLAVAAVLGAWFLKSSIDAARTKELAESKRLMLVSVIYLPVLFLAMVLTKLD